MILVPQRSVWIAIESRNPPDENFVIPEQARQSPLIIMMNAGSVHSATATKVTEGAMLVERWDISTAVISRSCTPANRKPKRRQSSAILAVLRRRKTVNEMAVSKPAEEKTITACE